MTETIPAALDVAEARELLSAEGDSWLVDVRTPGEYGAVHVPGSYNVPLDKLRAHASELSTEEPFVLLCASGQRAEQARAAITESAPRATVVSGGIAAWERDGGPVKRGSGVWAMERQVRLVAGLLVLLGVVASTAYEPLKWIAGFVGAGLTFAAVSNTCAMARLLALLPHNRSRPDDTQALLAHVSE